MWRTMDICASQDTRLPRGARMTPVQAWIALCFVLIALLVVATVGVNRRRGGG